MTNATLVLAVLNHWVELPGLAVQNLLGVLWWVVFLSFLFMLVNVVKIVVHQFMLCVSVVTKQIHIQFLYMYLYFM
jgi:hypothetical protein